MAEANYLIEIMIIVALILVSGFFSGSETALTGVSRAQIYRLMKKGNKAAGLVSDVRENKESMIGAILLGNNLVNIAAASLATTMAIKLYGVEWGPLYSTIAMTFLVLIFAEILPKTIAINNAEKVALVVVYPLRIIMSILSPITKIIQAIIAKILWFFDIEFKDEPLTPASELIRGTIDLQHEEGRVEKMNRDMLGSILDLDERQIDEVMIHRTQVEAIDMTQEPEAIIAQIIGSQHSRLPLYRDRPDNITGIIHAKDVLRLVRDKGAQGMTREMIRRRASRPWFVPETTNLADQLFAFRTKRKHFACVVDEYGDWQGIVTLEDIIEEIVGEIDDEHDHIAVDEIIPFGKDAWRIEGSLSVRDINRHLDWELPVEDATTMAGLVLNEARSIPPEGAVFEFHGVRFVIEERVGHQLTRLQIAKVA